MDWAEFIKKIADEWYPDAEKIALVMDNLATQKASAFYETYLEEACVWLHHRNNKKATLCIYFENKKYVQYPQHFKAQLQTLGLVTNEQ